MEKMNEPPTIHCYVCDTPKKKSNHWYTILSAIDNRSTIANQGHFHCWPQATLNPYFLKDLFDNEQLELCTNVEYADVCSYSCALKLMSQWLDSAPSKKSGVVIGTETT